VSTRTRLVWLAVPISLGVLALALVASSLGASVAPSGPRSALVGSAPVGKGPSTLALDPATHTIYVANGNNANGPNAGGDTVSVIDVRRCDAHDVSRCKGPWPTITVGKLPAGIAIDEQTDTVYVASVGDNSVSVFNGSTCNAVNTSGCRQTPASVPVGLQPLGLFADPANHTVYVTNIGAPATGGNPGNSTTVSMINSATCNATDLAACPTTPPPTVTVGGTPTAVTVDQDTGSVYVTTIGKGLQNGWSVFSAATCNATEQSGCEAIGRLAGDPAGPNDGEVDEANDTLYTANYDNTISAFNLHDCNAADLAGCASDKPGTVRPVPLEGFEHDLWLTVDTADHSVYVAYQKDDALMVIDTNACGGDHLAGCAALKPHEIHTGADPESVVLDPQTQTLYTANEVDDDISVINPTRCNAERTSGCRHLPPEAPISGPGGVAADPAVATTYVTSGANTVAMINTRRCNAAHSSGCSRPPKTVKVGDFPSAIAVNAATHTVYIANHGTHSTGTISVLNERTCNATHRTGCTAISTLRVTRGNPDAIAVDPATDTVYVVTIANRGRNRVSVFDGATCNASDSARCSQTPASVPTGDADRGQSVGYVAVDDATNTVYATNVTLGDPFIGDRVYVINGNGCDATNRTRCHQTPATVTAGFNPWGIAVDQATNTIYTANIANGEGHGTVSVVDGASCNGRHPSGCRHRTRTVAAGFGANGIAVDPTNNKVYATNIEDTSVSVINGANCNARRRRGCAQTAPRLSVADYPASIATDPTASTAYVQDREGVSVIKLIR
jgi:DNA-binding beta-propeller fold protein YncE